jgi:hypothetical protein
VAIQVEPTPHAKLDAVASLLASVFRAPFDSPFLDRRLLFWKYFEAGPRWNEARSYVLLKGDAIQAHCGVVPFDLHFSGQRVSSVYFTDWAGGRHLPGSGVLLMKKLMSRAGTAIVVGGSDDTRAVLPKIGFVPAGEVTSFARVRRPWRQFRTRPKEPLAKATTRLLRNTLWSHSSIGPIPERWCATRTDAFESDLNHDDSAYPTPSRDDQYLNYWLRCPAAEIGGYRILRSGSIVGYFLLSRVGNQTRISDIRLHSADPAEWIIAYRLAARSAAELPDTCEVLAAASTPFASKSLAASGFRNRGSAQLFLYDPHKKLSGAPPIFWNMIDGDAAYLREPASPYLT